MSTKKQFEDADGPKDGRKPAVDDKKKGPKKYDKKDDNDRGNQKSFWDQGFNRGMGHGRLM